MTFPRRYSGSSRERLRASALRGAQAPVAESGPTMLGLAEQTFVLLIHPVDYIDTTRIRKYPSSIKFST